MKTKQLIKYLRQASQANALTPFDAALALITLRQEGNSENECKLLYRIVSSENKDWINVLSLKEVSLRLLAISQYKPESISGKDYAALAKRLVAAEISIGGPYGSDEVDIIITNALIAQLFIALGSPLPKITEYLTESINEDSLKTLDRLTLWALSWPAKLIDTQNIIKKREDIDGVADVVFFLSTELVPKDVARSTPRSTNSVLNHIKRDLNKLNPAMQKYAIKVFEGVATADKNLEITMLSHFFIEAIDDHSPKIDKLGQGLGIANFYAWMAYTIYDDFIDDEANPAYLPIANLAHRLSLKYYLNISNKLNVQDQIFKAYSSVDDANLWELENCRFIISVESIQIGLIPEYGDGGFLAKRAFGHILGPLIISESIDKFSATQKSMIEEALTHYLIARQLNDDLHDWVEDFRKGHISFVVAYLLKGCNVDKRKYILAPLENKMKEYFWQKGLEEITNLTIHHTNIARKILIQSANMNPDSKFISSFIMPIEDSAKQGLAMHLDKIDFLNEYH